MNDAELFIQHLDRVTGRREDVIRQVDSTHASLPRVSVFIYKNWPKEGFITGFTFGLSAVTHPSWKFGRPELMTSMESRDESWCFGIAYLAAHLRGKCAFGYGNTINFRAAVSEESALDAFLVFAPPFLKNEQQSVSLNTFTCNITGMYPMYSSEIPLYHELGLEKFWKQCDWDPLNPHRRPLK